jgi:Rrf2 family iron-sulfur cluster assembly transcriptional regulator
MRFSTQSRYGVRAIFDIAYHGRGKGVQIKDIARRQEISPRYLEQIFQPLRNAGIISSKRGPTGGYSLARAPQDIRVGDIVRVTERGFDPVSCIHPEETGKNCSRITDCVTRIIWEQVGEKVEGFLDSVTVQDLCRKAELLGVQKEEDRSSISPPVE